MLSGDAIAEPGTCPQSTTFVVSGRSRAFLRQRSGIFEGEAVGYRHLVGVDLLPADQRNVVAKLPDEFKFTDVLKASGKGPKTVAEWLRGWKGAGVVEKHGQAKSKN